MVDTTQPFKITVILNEKEPGSGTGGGGNGSGVGGTPGGTGTGAGGNGNGSATGTNNPSTFNSKNSGTSASAAPNTNNVKIPASGPTISNPMHQYASWTYRFSLWWLSPTDFNNLVNSDVGVGLNLPLPNSYVIAEDGGTYANNANNPTQRIPSSGGLNYNIQNVEFDTVVGLNTASKHSNLVSGTIKIMEPYGVTFIDTLVYAGIDKATGKFINHTTIPYMLQVDFVGYDDLGNQVPSSETGLYRKRFPIRFTAVKVNVNETGATYDVEFVPATQFGFSPRFATAPLMLKPTGKTVQDVLNDMADQINQYQILEIQDNKRNFCNPVAFKIDPAIGNSTVNYQAQMTLAETNPNGTNLDFATSRFIVPYGTTFVDAIHRILIQSSYILDQLGINLQKNSNTTVKLTEQQSAQLTTIFNSFKTSCLTNYQGMKKDKTLVPGAYDNTMNMYALSFTYNIHQYPVYDFPHPAGNWAVDPRPYLVKNYNYLYTGKNVDILKFDLHFDVTWYTPVNAYPYQSASTQTTASTNVDTKLADGSFIMLSPQWFSGVGINAFGAVPALNQISYQPVQPDHRETINTGSNINPQKAIASNAIQSLYSKPSGDMVDVELVIVGDPTLIKQDDILYSPDPTGTSAYNSWDAMSHYDYAKQYGTVRFDTGQLVVNLVVNSIVDIDSDWSNQGLATPTPGSYKSLFSGLYKIYKIKNSFNDGQFTQTLSLYRISTSDFITNSAPNQALSGAATRVQQTSNDISATVDASSSQSKAAGDSQNVQNSVPVSRN
jgi:hypothetical protein